jgi:hypothetical protein
LLPPPTRLFFFLLLILVSSFFPPPLIFLITSHHHSLNFNLISSIKCFPDSESRSCCSDCRDHCQRCLCLYATIGLWCHDWHQTFALSSRHSALKCRVELTWKSPFNFPFLKSPFVHGREHHGVECSLSVPHNAI